MKVQYNKTGFPTSRFYPIIPAVGAVSFDTKIDLYPYLTGCHLISTAFKRSIFIIIRILGYLQEEYTGYKNDLHH